MVTRHFCVRCHHQLNVARVGQEALASAQRPGVCGVVFRRVLVIDSESERVQLLSHNPPALKWPLGVPCWKKENYETC